MKLTAIQGNPILRLTVDFGVAVIQYCENLDALKKFAVAKQLLRSGTAVGANTMEAQNGESKADFIHKMKIAAKEACETQYWLLLCERSGYPDTQALQEKLDEINRLLTSIISTAKRGIPVS